MQEPIGYNLEEWFKFYLFKMSIDANKLTPIQYIELKRAFYGGFSVMQTIMATKIGNMESQAEAQEVFGLMLRQTTKFWNNQAKDPRNN